MSKSRYLWNFILRRDVVRQRAPLPCYRKPTEELGASQLELLTRRALRATASSQSPVVTRLDQGRSVTWLRLIHGQYLLVAAARPNESTIALYALADIQKGNAQPVARGTLPGPVSSGEMSVQDDQVVLALCFQSP